MINNIPYPTEHRFFLSFQFARLSSILFFSSLLQHEGTKNFLVMKKCILCDLAQKQKKESRN